MSNTKDYWCDGHFVANAGDVEDAAHACRAAYGFWPERVRPWTEADQRELDRLTDEI